MQLYRKVKKYFDFSDFTKVQYASSCNSFYGYENYLTKEEATVEKVPKLGIFRVTVSENPVESQH